MSSGADPEAVSDLMDQLKNQGSYQASKTLMEKTSLFYAGAADEAETAQAIKAIFDETHYLMDPHTAVANKVYEDYLKETEDATKTVIVSTPALINLAVRFMKVFSATVTAMIMNF